MDVTEHHRTLADGRRAALDRAGAHVADRVDPRHARLEQPLGAGIGAGEDEAVLVATDGVAEPVGARDCTEEEKEDS